MAPPPPPSNPETGIGVHSAGEEIRILYVDDEPTLTDVGDRLEGAVDQFRVFQAQTVATATDILDEHAIDCLVCGYGVGRTDGLEILDTMLTKRPTLPVVLFAEPDTPVTPEGAYDGGASSFVRKRETGNQVPILANRIDAAVQARRMANRYGENVRQLKTLLGNIPGVAYRSRNDPSWPMEYLGDGFESLTGYDPSELIDGPVSYGEDILHPDDREEVWETIQRSIENDEPFLLEYRIHTADGSEKWVWERGRGVPDGETALLEGIILDITERKASERELEYQTSLLDALNDATTSGQLVVEADGTIVSSNRRFWEMWQVPDAVRSAEQSGSVVEWLLDATVENVDGLRSALCRGDLSRTATIAGEIDLDSGRRFHYHSTPLEGDDDTYFGRLVVFRDITEQTRREEALQVSEYVFQSAISGIAVASLGGEIVKTNTAFVEMWGYDDGASVIGKPIGEFIESKRGVDDVVETVLEEGSADGEATAERADGTRFEVAYSASTVTDDDGTVLALMSSFLDVTKRKERMDQIKKIDRILRHNFGNELNVVSGYGNVIRREAPEPFATHAAKIVDSSERLLSISQKERRITELLSEGPEPRETDLRTLLKRVSEDLESRYPDADLRTNLPPTGSVWACKRIGIALRELVENAIHHGSDDEPRVEITGTLDENGGTITVSDNGTGIPETERALLTGELDIGPLSHGSGMGLWLVHLVVRRSNGTLEFGENDPQGSVVTLHLPGAGGSVDDG
ncbi:MAG: PAS domain S-box protein [Halanaeroarchaeum sp.]